MVYKDKLLTCQRCGRKFVFTVTEQRELAERGAEIFEPKFCPACRSDMKGVAKLIGRVKWFSPKKGYGFITKADGEDIFVHRSGIVGSRVLREGQEVEFEIERTPRGPRAVKVAPLPTNS